MMVLKNDGRVPSKNKRRKLVKCDICKAKIDILEARELGNITTENGVTVLYCDCGNQIVIKI